MLVFIHRANADYVIAALTQILSESSDLELGTALVETIEEIKKEVKAFDIRPMNQRMKRDA